jgi:signal transduction histidine kinase
MTCGPMEDRQRRGPGGATGIETRTNGPGVAALPSETASSGDHDESPTREGTTIGGFLTRSVDTVREYLPRGNTLDEETFRQRHLFLSWVLGLHVPALFLFGLWRGYGATHSALEVVIPIACLIMARLARNRRLAAFFITAGLVFCSSVLVHLSGGMIEAHFHFFILVGLIALYQDWVPFLWNVLFTVVSHGAGSVIAGDLMFNHEAGQEQPWSWAAIHGVAVLAACVSEIIFWKNTELQQRKNTSLASELATVHATVEQRESVSELFVNLARRNQSLLDRQLDLISELEQRERDADVLADLFQLDHLATRIRRNAESLLVLSGDEPQRRWGRPVPLSEVVRAAAAEVEDYRRVEVMVNEHLEVAGRAVADFAHLLAELIENATTFSPPSSEVRIRSHLAAGEYANFVLSIEDVGIGMSDRDIAEANLKLADPPDVDLRRSAMLGFHVVGRLAKRYGLQVTLAHTPGGGLTALVLMPPDMVSERRPPTPAQAPPTLPATASMVRPTLLADQGGVAHTQVGATPPGALAGPGSVHVLDLDGPVVNGQLVNGRMLNRNGHEPSWRADERGGPEAIRRRGTNGYHHAPGTNGWHGPLSDPVESPAPRIAPEPGVSPAPMALPDSVPLLPDVPAPSPQPEAPRPPAPQPEALGPPAHMAPPGGQAGNGGRAVQGGHGGGHDGLAKRVPGAGLSPSLRRGPANRGPDPTPNPARDHERVRSMLSRFQEGQRAGRAIAGGTDRTAEEDR